MTDEEGLRRSEDKQEGASSGALHVNTPQRQPGHDGPRSALNHESQQLLCSPQ